MLAWALVVAVAAAIRSTWSPCGLSMLSTVTPLAERSRGHRFGVTAAWFVVGATLGGATLGLVAAALAVGVRALGPSAEPVATAWPRVAALVAGGLRHRAVRVGDCPFHRRQVDELWLGRYRPWVYASGFGWQIGVGVATYIMTAAVYLVVVLAALTASPAGAPWAWSRCSVCCAAWPCWCRSASPRPAPCTPSTAGSTPGARPAGSWPSSSSWGRGRGRRGWSPVRSWASVVATGRGRPAVIDVRGMAGPASARRAAAADELGPRPGPVGAERPCMAAHIIGSCNGRRAHTAATLS